MKTILEKLQNKLGCELYSLIAEYGDNITSHLGDGRYEFYASHDGFDEKFRIDYGFRHAHGGEVIFAVRKYYNRIENVGKGTAVELFDVLGYIPVVKAYCEKVAWEKYDNKSDDE